MSKNIYPTFTAYLEVLFGYLRELDGFEVHHNTGGALYDEIGFTGHVQVDGYPGVYLSLDVRGERNVHMTAFRGGVAVATFTGDPMYGAPEVLRACIQEAFNAKLKELGAKLPRPRQS